MSEASGTKPAARGPRRGELLEVEVESLAFGGRGVARAEGFVVFVAGGLPGDRVRAEVTKAKKRFAEARAVELLRPAADRVPDRCTHGGEPCPGAPWQGLDYQRQLGSDRYLGPEQADVRYRGEVIGHVTTAEYGSQMLSLGGVHHLTGGSKKEGRITLEAMTALGNRQPVELEIDRGSQVTVQAGRAPIVNGVEEQRMRVGCGSATIGIFARQFFGLVDEVVVVDDHITGVLTEHQAGRCLDMRPSGVRMRGRKSTPGRWFQVANPGTGWGGTDLDDPLAIVEGWDPKVAWPGMRLLMTSTTGEHATWYVLDEALVPREARMPAEVRAVVERIGENCEPSLATVLFLGGAGGSLRAGVTENPILLTRSIKQALVNVTMGGAPAYVWPGGGITVMADVMRMPENSFGTVPTPAIVAPIEFSMRLDEYRALGGHMDYVRSLPDALAAGAWHDDGAPTGRRFEALASANPWPLGRPPQLG